MFGDGLRRGAGAAAVSGCSGGSGSGSSAAAPGHVGRLLDRRRDRPRGPAAPTAPHAAAPDDPGPADAPAVTQSGTGDRKVTAVFQPAGSVTAARLAQLTQLVKARAALIAGTVVTVTGTSAAITVVGDTTQADAIKAIGRQVTVAFRPVLASPTPTARHPAHPGDSGEAYAENVFQAVDCRTPTPCPPRPPPPTTPSAAPTRHQGPARSGRRGGTDVSSATAKNGPSGWEVDIVFTPPAPGHRHPDRHPGPEHWAAWHWSGTTMVPSRCRSRRRSPAGAAQISGLTQDAARRLAAILDLGAAGASLTTASVSVRG